LIGPTLPDSLTFSIVSGLLDIAHQQAELQENIYQTLWSYARCIIHLTETTDSKYKLLSNAQAINTNLLLEEYIVSFILPSMAGLARALQVSPFLYKPYQLQSLCENMQPLIVDKTLDNIRNAIEACLQECDDESHSRLILASYWEAGTPLSSNRIIHDLLIILRNVSARVIALANPSNLANQNTDIIDSKKLHLTVNIEEAWSDLMKKVADGVRPQDAESTEMDKKLNKNLRGVYVMSLGYFDDIRKYAEKRENEGKKWSFDSYMKEIMGTSLVSHL
jgi:phosphatidylinositol 4-kinase